MNDQTGDRLKQECFDLNYFKPFNFVLLNKSPVQMDNTTNESEMKAKTDTNDTERMRLNELSSTK